MSRRSFDGITRIFVRDQITQQSVQKLRSPRHKSDTTCFKSDDDAVYAETHEIDLRNVRSFFAWYPKPDDLVPVQECEEIKQDGLGRVTRRKRICSSQLLL